MCPLNADWPLRVLNKYSPHLHLPPPAEPAATPASNFPADYLQRVKETHQVGWLAGWMDGWGMACEGALWTVCSLQSDYGWACKLPRLSLQC